MDKYLSDLFIINGDRYYDVSLKTRSDVISVLSNILNPEQAKELYDALPIEVWVENTCWCTRKDIFDKIENTLIEKEFRLDYFGSLSCQSAQKRFEQGSDENKKFYRLITIISTYIVQHVYTRWVYLNRIASELKIENTFMVPAWLGTIVPLFSGVGVNKFKQEKSYNQKVISFNKKLEKYTCKIILNNKRFFIYIRLNDLTRYMDYLLMLEKSHREKINNESFIIDMLDQAFSNKGLFYLLSIFCYYEKYGRSNKIDSTISEFVAKTFPKTKQTKQERINYIIRILVTFRIIKISFTRMRRPVSMFSSVNFKKKGNMRTFQFQCELFFNYEYLKDERNNYLLPDFICKENLTKNKLIYFLTILFMSEWVNSKKHVIEYRINDLIRTCNIEFNNIPDKDEKDEEGVEESESFILYMEKENIKNTNDNKLNERHFTLILKTIRYMKANGYIGDWRYLDNNLNVTPKPERNRKFNWSADIINITPPIWFIKFRKINKIKTIYHFHEKPFMKKKYTGEEIKQIRKTMNENIKEFSKRLDISPGYLSRIENMKIKIINDAIQNKIYELDQEINRTR